MPNSLHFSRRTLLAGIAAAAGASTVKSLAAERDEQRGSAVQSGRRDVIVVGAGVFGAWTAWHLLKLGRKVLLLDAWGPAHARASSGGESRMTRTVYGRDEIYTRFAWESLDEWRWLSGRSGLPIFHPTGVVFFFGRREPYVTQSIEVHQRIGMPLEVLDRADAGEALSADRLGRRRARPVRAGPRRADGAPRGADAGAGVRRGRRRVSPGRDPAAEAGCVVRLAFRQPPASRCAPTRFVFACGPWLPKVFPRNARPAHFPDAAGSVLLRARGRRQRASCPATCPAGPTSTTATSTTACRTSKHAASRSPTTSTARRSIPTRAIARRARRRSPTSASIMKRRFPALANRPLVESRVCQYENSSNGDLLIDRHPQWENVVLVGAGSGHGFKHGPAVGKLRRAAGERHEQEHRAEIQLAEQGRSAATGRALTRPLQHERFG